MGTATMGPRHPQTCRTEGTGGPRRGRQGPDLPASVLCGNLEPLPVSVPGCPQSHGSQGKRLRPPLGPERVHRREDGGAFSFWAAPAQASWDRDPQGWWQQRTLSSDCSSTSSISSMMALSARPSWPAS